MLSETAHTSVRCSDPTPCVDHIIAHVGNDIRLAVPIGIGKPLLLLNALYNRAAADPSLHLTIFTGLTLTRPHGGSWLEQQFAEPLLHRLFSNCPEAAYVSAQRAGSLPPNIKVVEFFLQAGEWLGNDVIQRNYTSLNYSDVADHLERQGTNVFAQLVSTRDPDDGTVSLASNTDITLDVMPYIKRCRHAGLPVIVAGEINGNLPYMTGDAIMAQADFDLLLQPATPHYDLFAPPKEPVSLVDHAIALRAATLIKDGGTLQIGIGSLADALSHALVLRHTRNEDFRRIVQDLGGSTSDDVELAPFKLGLYGCTEMLTDGYLRLMEAGILSRHVADPQHGTPTAVHAGFFIGNRAFYEDLRALPEEQRQLIAMTGISFTNTLTGDYARKCEDRRDARFFNTGMTATVLGAVSSDSLETGKVVSGVGGQLDFATMAQQLPGARAIVALRSAHGHAGKRTSNIVWSHEANSVPRSLRDFVVSEYGIADVRGKSDRDTAVAMIAIADRRFQDELLLAAVNVGKIEGGFRPPTAWRNNQRETIEKRLGRARAAGLLPVFPLGTEMTNVEQSLVGPLQHLKDMGSLQRLGLIWRGWQTPPGDVTTAALQRLGLDNPRSLTHWLYSTLIKGAMATSR